MCGCESIVGQPADKIRKELQRKLGSTNLPIRKEHILPEQDNRALK